MSSEKPSYEITDPFVQWETDFKHVEMPAFDSAEKDLELYINQSVDPILSAKAIQQYVDSQPFDAHEKILIKFIDLLNIKFMSSHMGGHTSVTLSGQFGYPSLSAWQDMSDVMIELEEQGEVKVGGFMNYFIKDKYAQQSSGDVRPILSLRLDNSAYVKKSDDGEDQIIGIHNSATIPVHIIVEADAKEYTDE